MNYLNINSQSSSGTTKTKAKGGKSPNKRAGAASNSSFNDKAKTGGITLTKAGSGAKKKVASKDSKK